MVLAVQRHRIVEPLENLSGHGNDGVGRDQVSTQHDKLIAAESSDHVGASNG